ncbi:MAG: MFS transporter [Pseudomonadota bacterium]
MFYGWIILAALSGIYFFAVGTVVYGFSVIIPEMITAMNWTRSEASLGYSILAFVMGMSGPVAAYCINRFGARMTMTAGGIIGVFGAVCSFSMNSLAQYYIFIGIVALGLALLSVVPGLHILAHWFARKRALAIGIFMSMGGVGAFFAAPAISLMVQATGNWRDAWLVMAGTMLIGTVIAAIFVRETPAHKGTFVDGLDPATVSAQTSAHKPAQVHQSTISWEIKDALRTIPYWMIVAAVSAVVFGHGVVNSQGVLHLRDLGISPVTAASAIGIIGMLGAAGRLFTGILGDRIDPRYLLAFGLVAELAGIVLLIFANNIVMVYIFAVVFGAGNGMAIVAGPALLANYFGNRNYASLIAIRGLIVTPVSALGPIIAGYTFDSTGSYTSVFLSFAVIGLIPVLILLIMRPPMPAVAQGTLAVGPPGIKV